MPVSVSVEGLGTATALLTYLQKLGSSVGGAELRAIKRDDGEHTNAEIMEFLADGNSRSGSPVERDIQSVTQADTDEIAQTFLTAVEKHMKGYQKRLANAEKRLARAQGKGKASSIARAQKSVKTLGGMSPAKQAQQSASKGMKEAIRRYKQIVSARIEGQVDFEGSALAKLSEKYAKDKRRKFGFDYPMLKASGQLLENLADDTKNIKILKK